MTLLLKQCSLSRVASRKQFPIINMKMFYPLLACVVFCSEFDSLAQSTTPFAYTVLKQGNGLGYGYTHKGNILEDNISATFSNVTIECNKVFGGVLWHIRYGGVQFINNFAQGRQVQMSCRWALSPGASITNIATEVGKRDGFTRKLDQPSVFKYMGSPMVFGYNDSISNRICTAATPMEFNQSTTSTLGGGTYNPVLYSNQQCSKVIDYNYKGMGSVMRYQQNWKFPIASTSANFCQMEASIHLNADLTNVFRYHPETGVLENMAASWWKKRTTEPHTGPSGGYNDNLARITCFIFGDANTTHCLGVVACGTRDSGSWDRATAINVTDGVHTGEFDSSCNVLYLLNWKTFKKSNTYYYYIVVGDLNTVTNKAKALYDTRTNHQW